MMSNESPNAPPPPPSIAPPPTMPIESTDAATTLLVIASPQRTDKGGKEKGKQGGRHEIMRGWSPEEDTQLFDLYNTLGPNWKKIAGAMGDANPRTPAMCRNRYLRIKKARLEVDSGVAYNKRGSFNKCGRCGATKKGHTCLASMQTAQPNLEAQRRLHDLHRSVAPTMTSETLAAADAELAEAACFRPDVAGPLSVTTASPGISRDVSPVTTACAPFALGVGASASASPYALHTIASLPSPSEPSPAAGLAHSMVEAVAVVDSAPTASPNAAPLLPVIAAAEVARADVPSADVVAVSAL